ncbi:ligase [Chloroflexia bacterium SDU3-3]|nr:ligase [Chloroflexia bacterium SDU3-3]
MDSSTTEPNVARLLPWSIDPTDTYLASGIAMLAQLEHQATPALRWSRVAPASLILGSSQRVGELDLAACAQAGLAIHRRASGGGIVLNEDMLQLDIALPRSHPLATDDVTESYRWVGEAWADAFAALGVATQALAVPAAREDTRSRDPLLRHVCFGGQSPYEVMVGGRKLVGLAQIRRRGNALFQIGIYTRWQPQRNAELLALAPPDRERLAELLGQRVIGLEELGPQPSADVVIASFERALAQRTGMRLQPDAWRDTERAALERERGRFAALAAEDAG